MKITLIGLGVGKNNLSQRALQKIQSGAKVFCRTELTESASIFKELGVNVEFLDEIYRSCRNFDTLTKRLANAIINASKTQDVIYCVDGSVSSDNSCAVILKRRKNVEVIEGVSHVLNAIALSGLCGGYTALSAYAAEKFNADVMRPFVLYDLDSAYTASEWKLKLCDAFGDEADALLFIGDERRKIKLYQLDWFENYDYRTVLIVYDVDFLRKDRHTLNDLFDIVHSLRSENGCPWDREQTPESITSSTVEECYELVDAIKNDDTHSIVEECGDMYLQLVFQTVFGEENHTFNRSDVLSGICNKLISRHTHVFGCDKAGDGNEALTLWEKNKKKEKGFSSGGEYVESVPKAFPSCMYAQKIQKRAAKYNFDFSDKRQIYDKIAEECQEVKLAEAQADSDKLREEIGDLLFSAVNLARFYGVDSEEALKLSADKFKRRFKDLEQAVISDGKDIKQLSESELDKYYNAIKKS